MRAEVLVPLCAIGIFGLGMAVGYVLDRLGRTEDHVPPFRGKANL